MIPIDQEACRIRTVPLLDKKMQKILKSATESSTISLKGIQLLSVEDIPLEDHYDSDSSITAAANKSLDMSRSLGDKCAEITQPNSEEEVKCQLICLVFSQCQRTNSCSISIINGFQLKIQFF